MRPLSSTVKVNAVCDVSQKVSQKVEHMWYASYPDSATGVAGTSDSTWSTAELNCDQVGADSKFGFPVWRSWSNSQSS